MGYLEKFLLPNFFLKNTTGISASEQTLSELREKKFLQKKSKKQVSPFHNEIVGLEKGNGEKLFDLILALYVGPGLSSQRMLFCNSLPVSREPIFTA